MLQLLLGPMCPKRVEAHIWVPIKALRLGPQGGPKHCELMSLLSVPCKLEFAQQTNSSPGLWCKRN